MTVPTDTGIMDDICQLMADGHSMRQVAEMRGMPSRATMLRWMQDDATFAAKCARAREMQADAIFEEMQVVADEGNPADVQRAKLRVSTMQWRASKLAPKKYGDKLATQHLGRDGEPVDPPSAVPAIINVTVGTAAK